MSIMIAGVAPTRGADARLRSLHRGMRIGEAVERAMEPIAAATGGRETIADRALDEIAEQAAEQGVILRRANR